MDYIRKSEKVLKTYRRLKYSIRTLEKRKQRIIAMGGPSDKVTATLEITGIRGSGNNMPAEQLIMELYDIEQSLKGTKQEMSIVDDVLRIISKEGDWWFGHLLRDWYVNKLTKLEIEEKYHSSSRNIYNMRNRALKEFSVGYFGIPATTKKEEGPN